jgi:hypothetical protein
MMPLRESARLVTGLGFCESVNVVLGRSTIPAGESLFIKDALLPPDDPHAPDDPSTVRQSDGLPLAPSIEPRELMIAARPGEKTGRSSGRAARSAVKPVTCDSRIGPVVPWLPPLVMAPAVATLTRTALTGIGFVPAGTDHVSWNCTRSSLLYTTVS